jgi:hypothetical protein
MVTKQTFFEAYEKLRIMAIDELIIEFSSQNKHKAVERLRQLRKLKNESK